ncbi:hypothetical protein [Archangium lipolyticum]|uniref:hypothetical protein n=1 Tax=Archangium lipolyticum TaxID=2970465 RepID=UPI00214A0340|nr:hypothetical protein [Archangium lipolyticum]
MSGPASRTVTRLEAYSPDLIFNIAGPAVQYLENGLTLLHEGSWQEDYELSRGLHVEMVEAAYLSGGHERMERYAREALSHAHQLMDVIQVHELKIQACQAQNRLAAALNLGLHG